MGDRVFGHTRRAIHAPMRPSGSSGQAPRRPCPFSNHLRLFSRLLVRWTSRGESRRSFLNPKRSRSDEKSCAIPARGHGWSYCCLYRGPSACCCSPHYVLVRSRIVGEPLDRRFCARNNETACCLDLHNCPSA